METKNTILLNIATNLVELSIEPTTVEQTLRYYYQVIVSASLQHQLDLTHPLKPSQFYLLLQKQSLYTHPILAMAYVSSDLTLNNQVETYQLPIHLIVLNLEPGVDVY